MRGPFDNYFKNKKDITCIFTGKNTLTGGRVLRLKKYFKKKFDIVFFQAGVDGLDSDALGLLKLSREGMKKRNETVFQWRKMTGLPMSIFMGGGYAKPIEDTIDSFCDLFMEVPKWL